MLARGRVVRQSKLVFYAKMAEKALQVRGRVWSGCLAVGVRVTDRLLRVPLTLTCAGQAHVGAVRSFVQATSYGQVRVFLGPRGD